MTGKSPDADASGLFCILNSKIEVIAMNAGAAVAARIIELCQKQDISINRPGTISGVSQSL